MATRRSRRGPYAREACAAIYAERTGRLASDDARLGWALAVRAAVREQALRAFANLGRARPLAVSVEWPDWLRDGLSVLSVALDAYRKIDSGWGVLVDYPEIGRDLIDPSDEARARRERWRALPETERAVARAKVELDTSPRARCTNPVMRAFFEGVSMRRPEVTASELSLLSLSVGLERSSSLDLVRRRWVERARTWTLSRARREELALLSATDLLLDAQAKPREGSRSMCSVRSCAFDRSRVTVAFPRLTIDALAECQATAKLTPERQQN